MRNVQPPVGDGMSRMAELWQQQRDDRELFDMADEQLSDREVVWMCAYCFNEVPHEGAPCCGEVHSELMPADEERPPISDLEDAVKYSKSLVWMQPRHCHDSLWNSLHRFYPNLTEAEIEIAINEGLNQL